MGQKVHPTGIRLGISKPWVSTWYASSKDFSAQLFGDHKVRTFLTKELKTASVSKIVIERPAKSIRVTINISEVRKPELDAQLVADGIASQLERRVMFRRAMKRSVQNAMRIGSKGIKVEVSGRLGGAEIARSEWYREGRVPLHTLRADIDYATSEALTTYGIIGVKVWIFKGEVIGGLPLVQEQEKPAKRAPKKAKKSAK